MSSPRLTTRAWTASRGAGRMYPLKGNPRRVPPAPPESTAAVGEGLPVEGRGAAGDGGDALALEDREVRVHGSHAGHLEPEAQEMAAAILVLEILERRARVQDRVVV